MTTARNRSHKHFQLDALKIKRAQKACVPRRRQKPSSAPWTWRLQKTRGTEWFLRRNERFIQEWR